MDTSRPGRFRRDRSQPSTPGLGRPQAISLLAALVVAVAGVAIAAVLVSPNRSRAFDLVRGTVFLSDARAPVAVDLATGSATVRLVNARTQVSAISESDVSIVPLADSTLLLNRGTGAFNMVDNTGFVIKTTPGGVALPTGRGTTNAMAVPADDRAFVVRTTASGAAVYLVARATVESAVNPGAAVKPRAFRTLDQPVSLKAGTAVTADGSLWLTSGTGSSHSILRLRVPADSENGATLDLDTPTTVTGDTVLATAADPHGGTAVGVAGSRRIQVFDRSGARTVNVPGITGIDRILPVTTTSTTLRFLYHGSDGWHLINVTDTARDVPLPALGTKVNLAAPVESNGTVYTMSTGSDGTIYSISSGGSLASPPDAARYPISVGAGGASVEARDFGDAQIIARQGRVIFNSPDHLLAVTVFSDGSHAPVTIDKSAAVDLNSIGGASALTKTRTQKAPTAPAQSPTSPKPVTPQVPVNEKATCATTTQTPHVPTITQATPASRSVRLAWTYPILDNQDCVPSTYLVQVRVVAGASNAPAAPGQVSVQGQLGTNLSGLYPNTRYEIALTAFINGKGTAGTPIQVTTGREGPKAPTAVTTGTDSTGTWSISWSGCADTRTGCVPASTWTVTPTFCDGLGLSTPLAPLSVSGDASLTSFTATYPGSSALLGRGLSFTVQGVSEFGDVGASAGDGSCARSWARPNAAAITLTASAPVQPGAGQTTSTTFTLHFAGDPVAASGGTGATYTYQLLSAGAVVATQGPSGATTAIFTGISPGRTYSGLAVIAPPGHPEAAVRVATPEISTRANWPTIFIVSAAVTRSADDPRQGSLTVQIGGVGSAQASGETFDLTGATFTCASAAQALTAVDFDPAATAVTAAVDLTRFYGDCTVSVALVEDGTHVATPPVFGGTTSPSTGSPVSMPDQEAGTLPASAFSAGWDSTPTNGHSTVTVNLDNPPPNYALVQNWSYQLSDGDSDDCASGPVTGRPPVTIEATQSCVQADGDAADLNGWTVTVSYQYFGSSTTYQTVITQVSGDPPTYKAPTSAPPSSTPPATTPPTTAPPTTAPPSTTPPTTSPPTK